MRVFINRRVVLGGVVATAATASIASTTQATIHDVEIKRFKFEPDTIQVKVGDIIRWTNGDLAPHTATADGSTWETEKLAKGESGEITVTADMETNYFCAFHPHMKAAFEII